MGLCGAGMSGEDWSIRELRALHAIINQQSITAAAAMLGVSQPAVSRTIAVLEARLGRPLFQRGGRSIVPTEEALRLNERVMPLLAALDDLRAEGGGLRPGQLRLVAPPAFANGFLQGAIANFSRLHPMIDFQLEVRSSDVVFGEVAEGLADLGISDMSLETRNVIRRPLCVSDAACFLPADHALAQSATLNVSDLAGLDLIALSRRHLARQKLDRLLGEAGLSAPRVRVETSTTLSALAFVQAGLGVAVMNPFPIALQLTPGVVAVPLAGDIEYVTSFLLPPSGPVRRSADRFMRHLALGIPSQPWLRR